MPRPMTRRPLVELEPDDPPEALFELPERDEPAEALRALLLPLFPLLVEPLPEPPLELRDPLLELPFPPLALIPPLLRFGMPNLR
jgi:hypothetical protein